MTAANMQMFAFVKNIIFWVIAGVESHCKN